MCVDVAAKHQIVFVDTANVLPKKATVQISAVAALVSTLLNSKKKEKWLLKKPSRSSRISSVSK